IGGPATVEAAINKLFRAAKFTLPEPGRWQIEVVVQLPGGPARVKFDADVAEPLPSWLSLAPWIGWPAVVIGLFLLHQFLAGRNRSKTAICAVIPVAKTENSG